MTDFGVKFKKDFEYGLKQEETLFNIIKEKFGDDIKMTSKKSIFDFENDKYLIELKSRNCLSITYPDTMVGNNKLIYASQSEKECYFLFNFKDGLFYWKYNEDDINKGLVKIKSGGRCDRGKIEINQYAFINKCILKEFYQSK
jgi:hypothetical protein